MIFKTEELVSVVEAKKIAARIKDEPELYNQAFKRAVAQNNGAVVWEEQVEKKDKVKPKKEERIKQYIKESYILNFPLLAFGFNGFSVKARNSVTVCMHEHQSKIWTRLSCERFGGEDATDLNSTDVQRFFRFAAANANRILQALAVTYMKHVKEAGVQVPKSESYFFQLRAFNSTADTSEILLNKLQNGMGISEALDDQRFKSELVDYFTIALGKKTKPEEIKKSIEAGALDVFGYKSTQHQALFTARITESQTDLCGYGYDIEDALGSNILSHATRKDLLKEYAQNF
jgi:hypothetical protein